MSDLASISDEWWHGAGKPVKMAQPDYYKEHRNIVNLLETTGKSLLNEAKDQKNEATAMAKKLKAPNPFYHLRGGDYWWGGDEEVYLDPEGNHISKEDYEKQFENQDKSPVEPEYPEQPQFVGDPTQFKPMPFDPNNPMMYMGSGSPFYHLRGGEAGDDEMTRRMAEYLAPHISSGIGQVADSIQDFLKSPEQREQEKRDKEALEEAERKKKEREESSWSSLLSPFFNLSGGAIDKYIAMAKEFAKRAGYKDWDSLRRADDGEHKLELRGVKFGRKGYGDFIKYSLDEGVDEARKHRDAYLARATKIRGDWAKDMYSPNSLAINILWGGGLSGGMKSESELEDMSVVKLIDYGKSLGIKGLDGKTKKVIMDKILNHKETVKTPDVVDEWAEEREKAYNLLIDQPLDELKKLAKDEKITRIPHKNKEKLARELANKYVDDAVEQTLNPPKPRITDPDDPDFEGVEYSREDMRRQREAQAQQAKAETLLKKRMRRQAKKPKAWNQEAYEKSLGLGRPYTAEEWEQKLCKGENSLLAQKKRKIKERAEKGVPALETPMRTSRVIKATPPKEAQKYYFIFRGKPSKMYEGDGDVFIMTPDQVTAEDFRHRLVQTIDSNDRAKAQENKYRKGTMAGLLPKTPSSAFSQVREGNADRVAGLAQVAFKEQSTLHNFDMGYQYTVDTLKKFAKKVSADEYKNLKKEGRIFEQGLDTFSFGSGKPVLAPQDVLEGKKDNPIVEEIIEEPMDDSDIRQYLPNAKVMRYSGLARLSDIEQLLPTDKSYVILLYENTPGSGHWVALMRYGNTIEFFCSYGSKIDEPLRWQNPKDNAMLGQRQPYLSILLNKAKGKFRAIHNPVAYQSKKQGVATCGAWDVMRINQMKNHNQDLQEFHNFMESVKKETGLTYDEIVVNYVSKR